MACESKSSKATGYAVISIKTAWLSYYYPLEFMTALLNSNINKNDKLEHYVAKVKSLGFNLLGPDINKSEELFSISYDDNGIRFGLRGIKGLGSASSLVIDARGEEEFLSLTEFATRLNNYSKCDKKVLECIAKSGGFESIEPNRRAIVESAEMIVDSLKKEKKKNIAGQISLFDCFEDEVLTEVSSLKLKDIDDYTKDEKLAFEKEYLSFYVSGHPLDKYERLMNDSEILTSVSDIKMSLEVDTDLEIDDLGFSDIGIDSQVVVIGQIVEEKVIQTKKGDLMCRISIEDKSGVIDCVLFPKVREAYRSRISEGKIVVVTGKVDSNDFGTQIIVEDVSSPQILSTTNNPYCVKVVSPFSGIGYERPKSVQMFRALRDFVSSYNGEGDLEIIFIVDGKEIEVGNISSSIDSFMKLKQLFGEDKLIFEY